jgi:hypothetical protein
VNAPRTDKRRGGAAAVEGTLMATDAVEETGRSVADGRRIAGLAEESPSLST